MMEDFGTISHVALSTWEAVMLLSLMAAPLGAFLIFRRLSFYGDALGHSALAGVAVILFMGIQFPWLLALGALMSVMITTQLVRWLEQRLDFPPDLALSVAAAGALAIGLVFAARSGANLEGILVGRLESVSPAMVWFLRGWTLILVFSVIKFWKPLWATVTDVRFSASLGYKTSIIDFCLLAAAAITVVAVIQSVGAILVSTYLVFPAAAALAWARSLVGLVLGSVVFALLASALGIYAAQRFQLPLAPTISVVAFVATLLSHIFQHSVPNSRSI